MRSILTRLALLTALCLPLGSCAGFWTPLETLTQHENPVVAIPSEFGAFTFGLAGVPVAVAALPITIPLGIDQNAVLAPLAPIFVCAQVGAIVFGGLPYLALTGFEGP